MGLRCACPTLRAGRTQLLQRIGSESKALPLRTSTYPRAKVKFETGLWFQGVLTSQADRLVQRHGWTLSSYLHDKLAASSQEALIRDLETFDPEFATWLAQHDIAPQED